MSAHVSRTQTSPVHVLYKFMTDKTRVQIWLHEQPRTRLEGIIFSFDEYMNIVIDDCVEVDMTAPRGSSPKKSYGRLLLKGGNITAVAQAPVASQ